MNHSTLPASSQGHRYGASHGSTKEYVVGLLLSLVLTAIPFALVMLELLPANWTVGIILIAAVAQALVQLVFFLHMNTSSEQIWNTATAVFIVLIVTILIIGSIWIIEHLNHNMLMGH